MAARFCSAEAKDVSTGTSTKTVLQLVAPANQALRITEVGISFQGTNNTNEPINVELVRQSTAGSGGAAVTPTKLDDDVAMAVQATAQKNITAGTETSGDILKSWAVHPQTGLVYTINDLAPVIVKGGGRLGIRVNTPANSVDCTSYINWEE